MTNGQKNYVNIQGSCTIDFEFFSPKISFYLYNIFLLFYTHAMSLKYIDHLGIHLLMLEHPIHLISLSSVAAESMATKRKSALQIEGQSKRYERKPFLLSLLLSVLVSCFSQYSQIFPCGQVRREDVISDSNDALLYKLP